MNSAIVDIDQGFLPAFHFEGGRSTGKTDHTGIRVYYTTQPREHAIGSLFLAGKSCSDELHAKRIIRLMSHSHVLDQ